jgi:hypothetical protein
VRRNLIDWLSEGVTCQHTVRSDQLAAGEALRRLDTGRAIQAYETLMRGRDDDPRRYEAIGFLQLLELAALLGASGLEEMPEDETKSGQERLQAAKVLYKADPDRGFPRLCPPRESGETR